MAYIDTTTTKPPRPRRTWRRAPRPGSPTLSDIAAGQQGQPAQGTQAPAAAPAQIPASQSGPQPVQVNPLPMPNQKAAPTTNPIKTEVDNPALLSQIGELLKTRLGSDVKADPRYLSGLADLQKKQSNESAQRKQQMIDLGITKDDGSDWETGDVLGEKHTREQLALMSEIEGLRNQDISSGLSTSGAQAGISQGNIQNAFQGAGLFGGSVGPDGKWTPTEAAAEAAGRTVGGERTLSAIGQEADIDLRQQAQDLSDYIQTGQLTLADANLAMQEASQAGGQFVLDPNTRKYVWQSTQAANEFTTTQTGKTSGGDQTLSGKAADLASAQTFGKAGPIAAGAKTLSAIGQEAGIEATRAGLSGQVPLYNADGTPAIDPTTKTQQMGTTLDAQRLGLQTTEMMGGTSVTRTDPNTGKPVTSWQDTLAGSTLSQQRKNDAIRNAILVGQQTGKYIDPDTGTSYDTQAALEQAFTQRMKSEELYGGVAPVTYNTTQIQAATGAKRGDPRYVEAFDIDGNGELSIADLNTVIEQSTNLGNGQASFKPVGARTLAGQTADTAASLSAKGQQLEEEKTYGGHWEGEGADKKWVGTLDFKNMDGNQKLAYAKLAEDARATRADEHQRLVETLGFSDTNPGQMSYQDWERAFADSTAKRSFDPSADFNADGKVTLDDYSYGLKSNMLAPLGTKISTVAARSLEASISQASATLGLDKNKLTEATRQFNIGRTAEDARVLSELTGYVYDPVTGEPKSRKTNIGYSAPISEELYQQAWADVLSAPGGSIPRDGQNWGLDLNEDGLIDMNDIQDGVSTAKKSADGYWSFQHFKEVPLTTVERDAQGIQVNQFNQTLNQDLDKFLKQMGLTMDQIKSEQDTNKFAAYMGLIASVIGGISQIGAAAAGRAGNTSGGGVRLGANYDFKTGTVSVG